MTCRSVLWMRNSAPRPGLDSLVLAMPYELSQRMKQEYPCSKACALHASKGFHRSVGWLLFDAWGATHPEGAAPSRPSLVCGSRFLVLMFTSGEG